MKISAIDIQRQYQVERQFKKAVSEGTAGIASFEGKSVLCLGARLGGEVRAFKSLGALAVGVDLEPGDDNMDVVVGDFENLAFAPASFDFAFSNVLDHLFSLRKFSSEVCRVLKPGGFFFAALFAGKGDKWNGRNGVGEDNKDKLIKVMAKHGLTLSTSTLVEELMKIRGSDGTKFLDWPQRITTLYFRRSNEPAEQVCNRTSVADTKIKTLTSKLATLKAQLQELKSTSQS